MQAPAIEKSHPPASHVGIGVLAQRTGLNVSAIRFYEEIGLIAPAARRPSGHRVYGQDAQEVLTLIRHSRDLGFSIEETRALVSLSTDGKRDCVEARDIASAHLTTIRAKLADLQRLEQSLTKYVQACSDECAGGPAAQCTILKDLGSSAPQFAGRGRVCCG